MPYMGNNDAGLAMQIPGLQDTVPVVWRGRGPGFPEKFERLLSQRGYVPSRVRGRFLHMLGSPCCKYSAQDYALRTRATAQLLRVTGAYWKALSLLTRFITPGARAARANSRAFVERGIRQWRYCEHNRGSAVFAKTTKLCSLVFLGLSKIRNIVFQKFSPAHRNHV